MKLCLSARAWAAPGGKYTITVEELIRSAKGIGYDGITLRRGQLDETTSEAEAAVIRDLLERNDAPCSFVTGVAVRDEESLKSLCTIIDRAALVGAPVVQPTVRDDSEIPWMQQAADYAARRGIALAPQLHNQTRHANAEQGADLADRVGRKTFGMTFEASHLILQRREVLNGAAVRLLGKRVMSVCVQDYRLAPGEPDAADYEGTPYKPCLPDDARGVDLPDVFKALKEIGYDGFVTVMAGGFPGMGHREHFASYCRVLRKLI